MSSAGLLLLFSFRTAVRAGPSAKHLCPLNNEVVMTSTKAGSTSPELAAWPTRTRPDGSRTPKILHVTEDLGIGGLERVVVTLCKTLEGQEFSLGVACLRTGGLLADELRAAGIPVFVLGYDGPDYLAFIQIARLLRRHQVDVVHSHNTNAFMASGLARCFARRSQLVHTDHARKFPDKRRYMVMEHILSHVAHRVVGVSDHTTSNLTRYERIPQSKLMTIPNGIVDSPRPAPADVDARRRELGLPAGVLTLGMGARLTKQKNISMLLGALKLVRYRHPDIMLVVCGDGPERTSLMQQAVTLGIDSIVRFPGFREDMSEIRHLLDVYVSTSTWEGLPMAILEAMACGLPIVATRVGGVPTAVHHGENGVLVEPGDVQGFAEALDHVLSDADARTTFGRVGRSLFERSFTAEAMAARYGQIYNDAAGGACNS